MAANNKVTLIDILIAVLALPLMVIVVIPLSLHATLPMQLTEPIFEFHGQFILAIIIGLIGFALLYAANLLFVRQGQGTLAPWSPPKKLVVQGPYQYMRHPMISGVLLILLGELIYLSSWAAVIWFFFFLAANLIYIPLLEEKILLQRFGEEYQRYREQVPSWIPRHCSRKVNK